MLYTAVRFRVVNFTENPKLCLGTFQKEGFQFGFGETPILRPSMAICVASSLSSTGNHPVTGTLFVRTPALLLRLDFPTTRLHALAPVNVRIKLDSL